MKKNVQTHYLPRGGCVKKWLLFMRNLLFILFMSSLSLYASQTIMGQKVSIKVSNVSLKTIIEEIEKQTKLGFLYNEKEVVQMKNLSLDVKDAEVAKVLDDLLKGSPFIYSIDRETILISARKGVANDTVKAPVKLIIKGKVTDTKNRILPGVSVYIKGTTVGVATDVKGLYTITMAERKDLVLVFSFIGMKPREVAVKDQKVIDVVLEEDVSDLDEVRVIAYGKTTKRESMGAITSVKGDDLISVPTSNLSSLLQGRVAGMDIANMSGSPGTGGTATIIRGYNTLGREQRDFSSPLWVVDGIPISNLNSQLTGTNALAELDPDMIESIEVLKDAAATSMYGSRAANGVILVTTKRGKAGQRVIKAGVSYSTSFLPEYPTVLAGNEARRYKMKALRNYRMAYLDDDNTPVYPKSYEEVYKKYEAGYDYFWMNGEQSQAQNIPILQDSLNAFFNNGTNWFKRFFQTGKVVTANLQTLYGTERFNSSVGAAYYDESGILKGTGFTRFNLMTNLGFKPSDRLNVDVNMSVSYARRKRNQEEVNTDVIMGAGQNLINIPQTPFTTSPFYPANSVVEEQALRLQEGIKEKNEDIRARLGVGLTYEITNWLRVSTTNSLSYSLSRQNNFTPSTLASNGNSKSKGQVIENRTLLTENLLVFHKEFKDHKVEVLAGASSQLDEEFGISGSAEGGPNDYVYYVTSGWASIDNSAYAPRALKSYGSDYIKSVMVSFMGRFSYSFRQKYILGASVRRDGSSKFGRAVPWGTFPSLSAAWVFSDESFMDNFGFLDFGKVRVSWGETGSQFNSAYLAYGELQNGGSPFLGNTLVRPSPVGLRNKKLSWETTGIVNVGVDLDLFNYRLGIVFDYYDRYTDGMLDVVPLPGDYSVFTSQPTNAGAVSNKGVELTLKYEILRQDNLRWRVSFNIARNWNKFKKSYNGRDLQNYILGEPLNAIRRLKSIGIISDESEIPYKYTASGDKQYLYPDGYYGARLFYTLGDQLYLDANGDGMIGNVSDAVYLGSPLPKAQGGIMTEALWKNFDLGVNFTYSLGRTVVNATLAEALEVTAGSVEHPLLADPRKYTFWEKPGDVTDFPRLAVDMGKRNFGIYSDSFVEDVNYLRLKSVVLGYTVPEGLTKKIRLHKIRVYVSGENLWTWTNYSGLDPEAIDLMTGFDNVRKYPLSRKFTFGLSVNF